METEMRLWVWVEKTEKDGLICEDFWRDVTKLELGVELPWECTKGPCIIHFEIVNVISFRFYVFCQNKIIKSKLST